MHPYATIAIAIINPYREFLPQFFPQHHKGISCLVCSYTGFPFAFSGTSSGFWLFGIFIVDVFLPQLPWTGERRSWTSSSNDNNNNNHRYKVQWSPLLQRHKQKILQRSFFYIRMWCENYERAALCAKNQHPILHDEAQPKFRVKSLDLVWSFLRSLRAKSKRKTQCVKVLYREISENTKRK